MEGVRVQHSSLVCSKCFHAYSDSAVATSCRADEVNALVIDLGSHTVKAGYAGEDTPKALFPSVRTSQSPQHCAILNACCCAFAAVQAAKRGWQTGHLQSAGGGLRTAAVSQCQWGCRGGHHKVGAEAVCGLPGTGLPAGPHGGEGSLMSASQTRQDRLAWRAAS